MRDTNAISVNRPAERSVVAAVWARRTTLVMVEKCAYVIIVGVSFWLRVFDLGAAPLSASEAGQAVAAFKGAALPSSGSPLLYSINQVLIGLFGLTVGDAAVRLGAALIGTLLVWLPWLWRDRIGRVSALAASAMLAVSPTAVMASRTLDGTVVVAACALAALGFGLRYLDAQRPSDLIGLAIAIGLALISGPGLVTLAIVIGLGIFVVARWAPSIESSQLRWAAESVRQQRDVLRRAVLWGGAAFLVVSTVGLVHIAAISSVPQLVSAWLAASRGTEQIGALRVFQIMAVYEPLIVVFGLIALLAALPRATGTSVLLGIWSLGALILTLLQPGRQPLDLLLVLTPLALLGGTIVQHVVDALRRYGRWSLEGTVWLMAAPLAAYLAVTAGGFASGRFPIGDGSILGLQISLVVYCLIVTAVICIIVGGVFWLAIGPGALLRAGATVLWVALALIAFGNAWDMTRMHVSDPRELLYGPIATAPDVRDLVAGLAAVSVRVAGQSDQIAVSIAMDQPDPILAWYLRGFKNAQFSTAPDVKAPAIIAPQGVIPPAEPGAYVGAPFTIQWTWDGTGLSDQDVMRWFIYRDADRPTAASSVVLWVEPQ